MPSLSLFATSTPDRSVSNMHAACRARILRVHVPYSKTIQDIDLTESKAFHPRSESYSGVDI